MENKMKIYNNRHVIDSLNKYNYLEKEKFKNKNIANILHNSFYKLTNEEKKYFFLNV